MLNFSGKLFLCFAVFFCLAQISSSQSDLTFNWISYMKNDSIKKYHSRKADIEEKLHDIINDIAKKSSKLIEKAMKNNGNVQCIEMARRTHMEQLDSEAATAIACMDQIGEIIEAQFSAPNVKLLDAWRARNQVRFRLDTCRDSGKRMMNSIEDSFESNGKRCLM